MLFTYFWSPLPPPPPQSMLRVIYTNIRSCTTLNKGIRESSLDAFEAAEPVKYRTVSVSEVSQLLLSLIVAVALCIYK